MGAYSCLEDYENTGGIVFAKTKREATRMGADLFNGGDREGLLVSRCKGLDKYEATGVPAEVLIYDGWRFECFGCGMALNEDNLYDEGMSPSGVVGYEQGRIYCCHACRMESLAEDAARKSFGEAFLEMLRDMVRKRFPNNDHYFGEYPTHVCVRGSGPFSVIQARVRFAFPGKKHGPASLEYHHVQQGGREIIGPVKPEFYCCNGDREAFETFASTNQKDQGDE